MKKFKFLFVAIIAMFLVVVNVNADTATPINNLAELEACTALSGVCSLEADVEITTSIKINSGVDVVVDLNGHKLTGPDDGSANWYAFIVNGGTLTLKDSSSAQTGELYAKCYGVETKSGTFIMESGKITATKNATIGAAIVNYGGKVEIKGGTLVASNWAVNAQSFFNDAEVVISGGTFESTSDTEATVQIGGEYSKTTETVSISGGTFEGTTALAVSEDALAATVEVIGGKYSTDVGAYIPEDFKAEKDADGNYVVEEVEKPAEAPAEKLPANPDTSDSLVAYVALAIISILALSSCVILRKRFN